MEVFVEILKWYSVILLSIMEFVFIYNIIRALVTKEDRAQYIISFFLYAPVFMLAIWALGHGWY